MNKKIAEDARKVFELWFDYFAKTDELINKERFFEFFHSGYIAGTRFNPGNKDNSHGNKNSNIIADDINRNLDL